MIAYQRISLIILFTYLTGSCNINDKSTIEFKSFPKKYNLNGLIVETEEKYKGGYVETFDSLLILTNTPNNKCQIHIFNKNTFEYISHGGITGRGPGELANALLGVLDTGENCIWIPDYASKKISKFEIDSIINNNAYLPESRIPLPENLILIFYLPLGNRLFSASSFEPGKLIIFFNYEGKIIDSLAIEDKINLYESEGFQSSPNRIINYYTYTIHPDFKKIALAYSYSDHMIVINTKGDIINKTYGPNKIFQFPNPGNPDRITTNSFIKSNEDMIFCLYNGKRKFDVETNLIPTFGNHIHIYDWDGHPIADLELQFDAMSFALDFTSNRIITYSPEANTFVCYNFNINDLYD
ncbi:MAG: BF3164 family lipoprotein [Bacteroidales bacterium]